MRGLLVDVLKALQESGSLLETVRQKNYSSYCNSILILDRKMQQEASDEAIVAMIPIAIGTVMGMERRASVIQSSILEQPRLRRGRIVKENDKVIAN